MKRFTWLFIVSLILGGAAYAQDHPKVEVTGYYSYFRFNPENSSTLSSHSLNGGGGEISFYFSSNDRSQSRICRLSRQQSHVYKQFGFRQCDGQSLHV